MRGSRGSGRTPLLTRLEERRTRQQPLGAFSPTSRTSDLLDLLFVPRSASYKSQTHYTEQLLEAGVNSVIFIFIARDKQSEDQLREHQFWLFASHTAPQRAR